MIWFVCTDTLGYIRENQIYFLLRLSCLDFVQRLKMSFEPAKKTDGPADSEGEYSQVCLCRRSSHGIFIRQVVLSKSAYSSYKIM